MCPLTHRRQITFPGSQQTHISKHGHPLGRLLWPWQVCFQLSEPLSLHGPPGAQLPSDTTSCPTSELEVPGDEGTLRPSFLLSGIWNLARGSSSGREGWWDQLLDSSDTAPCVPSAQGAFLTFGPTLQKQDVFPGLIRRNPCSPGDRTRSGSQSTVGFCAVWLWENA